jgi:hypothetical protein
MELIFKAQETMLYGECNKIPHLVLFMRYELMLKKQLSPEPASVEAYSICRYAYLFVATMGRGVKTVLFT